MKKIAVNIVRGILVVLSKLPLKFHYFMGGIFAWLARSVFHYRYDVVMINLSRSFPDMKYKTLTALAKEFYRHLGEIAAEAVWFSGSNYRRLYDSEIVTITNPEDFNELFHSTP